MRNIVTILLSLISACAVALPTATDSLTTPADGQRQSVGLVISGGGAKGIAHIGVIQALEDNDIPIDYVTGTSMGAIVGGLYAAGYTPAEMMELILSRGFGYWSTGRIDPGLDYYFSREPESPSMFSMALSPTIGAPSKVPQSLISGIPMSFAFMDLFSAYTAQCGGDFDKLFVPYRSVASNVAGKHKHVFRGGRLSDAVRCSMSFPIVFQPIAVNDTLLYDGGIYDNFPVDVMRREFAPSIMIGVNVGSSSTGPQTSIMDQLDALVIQGKVDKLPEDEGIYMRINLDEFSLLDFPAARAIYKIGYDHAMAMMDTIKARIHDRTPADVRRQRRDVFKSQTPYVRFADVNVTGGTPRQNEYIKYLFRPASGQDTIGISRARDAFYRAVASGKIADLFPQATYNDTTGLFNLNLKATVKGRFKGSIGGYITSSTSSYLYFGVGYSTMSFSSLDANVNAWLGQTTMAATVNGRVFLHTAVPSAVVLQGAVSRNKYYENDHIFYSDKYPTFLLNHEIFGRAGWSMAAGRTGAVYLMAGYGSLRDSYYSDNTLDSYTTGRLRSRSHLWQVMGRYQSSTLDEPSYPRSGRSMTASVMGLIGTYDVETAHDRNEHGDQKWIQGEWLGRFYPALSSKFTLGIETNVVLSTRKLLPSFSASIAAAPSFNPTPSSNNAFNASLRAPSYVAAGLVPLYNINSNISARIGGYAFMPVRNLRRSADGAAEWGGRLNKVEAYSEAAVAYHFPFGTLAGYVNYTTGESHGWNVGLSLGVFVLPPRFLR